MRVRACALNHLDLWQRRGIARVALPLPHIPGSDVAGEVVDGAVRSPAGAARHAPSRADVRPLRAVPGGRDNLCARYDMVGYQSDGGYAELVAVPAANLIAIPDGVTFERAPRFR